LVAAPAMACETAGGPYDRALREEYAEVNRRYEAARAEAAKSIEAGSAAAVEVWRQRLETLEARAAQLRMMQIDALRGCTP
jgi:hypothetical protein